MTFWQEHDVEEKVIRILQDVPDAAEEHHIGRPYLTVYQLAIEFAQRHPEIVAAANWTVGGAGSGKGYSLTQYLATNLARLVRDQPAGPIERVFISTQQVNDISFVYGEELVHSAVTATSPALALYRLREREETSDTMTPTPQVESHPPQRPVPTDSVVQPRQSGQIAREPVVKSRGPTHRSTRSTSHITSLPVDGWRETIARSNTQAMRKRHKYPPQEGAFLRHCCTFQSLACGKGCFCRAHGNDGAWTLRQDLDFETFLHFYGQLWIGMQRSSFEAAVHDERRETGARWATGAVLLRAVKARWLNWDGAGHSLPELVSCVRRCFFCDDAFDLIAPFVRQIRGLCTDDSGVYTSKLVSQLFYDVAVPFDTGSKGLHKCAGYEPTRYGSGAMQKSVQAWLVARDLSVADFRRLDDAPVRYWRADERPEVEVGTACSRVLDKMFYGQEAPLH